MVKINLNSPAGAWNTAHYPFVTRLLIDLFLHGELPAIREIEIEPEYGYVGRIVYHTGVVRMFRGARVDLNLFGASEVATDKGYTKYFLKQLGYSVPRGRIFLLARPSSRALPDMQALVSEVDHYISEQIGYPCYLKPNAQAQGNGVRKCLDVEDVAAAIADRQQSHSQLFLVEEAIAWPDYRVVVLDNEVVACYRRTPFFIVGDGISTIRHLLERKQAGLVGAGRASSFDANDQRIAHKLRKHGLHFEMVLPPERRYNLHDISNLCAGGEAEDYTERIGGSWRAFCVKLVADMGLRLCGVDLACADLEQPAAAYSILEINAFPGLSNYATLGEKQTAIVRTLYQRIFTEMGLNTHPSP